MLCCCHCLCNQNVDGFNRINACYPSDGRPDPVAARVRELITWGSHDLSRFESIHEILRTRIRQDVRRSTVNAASVGTKILARLLENVHELNLSFCQALTAAVILLIKTEQPDFLELARDSTASLLAHANRPNFGQSVQSIVREYLDLCGNPEIADTAMQSLAAVLEGSSHELVRLPEVLRVVRTHWNANNSARAVVVALAHSAAPLTLPSFSETLFHFFDQEELWADPNFLNRLISTFFTEMKDNCGPPFFRLWLELLLPVRQHPSQVQTVLSVAVSLVEDLPAAKLLSQTQIDSLTTVFMFVIKLPEDAPDRAVLVANSQTLAHAIATHFARSELAKVAHHQLWEALPMAKNPTDSVSDPAVITIFKFIASFNDAISESITLEMAVAGIEVIWRFLVGYAQYSREILAALLEHLKQLGDSLSDARLNAVFPLLLALQDFIVENPRPCDLTLHTFVLCGALEVAAAGQPALEEYLTDIAGQRRSAGTMIDYECPFVAGRIEPPKKSKKKKKEKPMILIDPAAAIATIRSKRQRKAIQKRRGAFASPTAGEEPRQDDLTFEDDMGQEEVVIPHLTIRRATQTDRSQVRLERQESPEELAARKATALERIGNLTFEFRSVLGSVQL
jgi:hypothetical protein